MDETLLSNNYLFLPENKLWIFNISTVNSKKENYEKVIGKIGQIDRSL